MQWSRLADNFCNYKTIYINLQYWADSLTWAPAMLMSVNQSSHLYFQKDPPTSIVISSSVALTQYQRQPWWFLIDISTTVNICIFFLFSRKKALLKSGTVVMETDCLYFLSAIVCISGLCGVSLHAAKAARYAISIYTSLQWVNGHIRFQISWCHLVARSLFYQREKRIFPLSN